MPRGISALLEKENDCCQQRISVTGTAELAKFTDCACKSRQGRAAICTIIQMILSALFASV